MRAEWLDAALRLAGVPIDGVSIGRVDDRSTWRVRPETLQAQAQPVIDAFAEPTVTQLADEEAIREVDMKVLKAVAQALWETIPSPLMTKVQMRARAIAIYKALP